MTPRAPELGDACRVGGACKDCNDTRAECWECCAAIEPEDECMATVGGKGRLVCRDCFERLHPEYEEPAYWADRREEET